jgi:hypothetical protein
MVEGDHPGFSADLARQRVWLLGLLQTYMSFGRDMTTSRDIIRTIYLNR